MKRLCTYDGSTTEVESNLLNSPQLIQTLEAMCHAIKDHVWQVSGQTTLISIMKLYAQRTDSESKCKLLFCTNLRVRKISPQQPVKSLALFKMKKKGMVGGNFVMYEPVFTACEAICEEKKKQMIDSFKLKSNKMLVESLSKKQIDSKSEKKKKEISEIVKVAPKHAINSYCFGCLSKLFSKGEESVTYDLTLRQFIEWKRETCKGGDEELLQIINRMYDPPLHMKKIQANMKNHHWLSLEVKVCECCYLSAVKDKFNPLKTDQNQKAVEPIKSSKIPPNFPLPTLESSVRTIDKETNSLPVRTQPSVSKEGEIKIIFSSRLNTSKSLGKNMTGSAGRLGAISERPVSNLTSTGLLRTTTACLNYRSNKPLPSARSKR